MKDILSELRRRGVGKVVAGYAVVAWVIAQVSDLAADNFAAPAWLMPMLLVLLALGLPLAVVLAARLNEAGFDLADFGKSR